MPTLSFKGKTVIETYHHTVPHHTLEFDAKLSVLPKGQKPSLDGNLIIEGDNLLALKALLPTHAGKVKCVYIDPPYNTGNEGWVYNDNLTQPQFKEWIGQTVGKEGEDATRHDKWCCMMYPRLALLQALLRDDGSIWVSIDDHEVHSLRMLMDEVFGVENFVATVVWKPRYSPPNDNKGIAAMHDFIVVYRKTNAFERGLLPRSGKAEANYSNPDGDERGDWISGGYIGNKSRSERPNSWYGIKRPKDKKVVWPDENAVWRFSPETHEKNVKDNRLYWGPDGLYEKPRFKRFRTEVKAGIVPGTWWEQDDTGNNDSAKRELVAVLGEEERFSNPKPVPLIERVLKIATEEDDIILDSFAGSGTTGHAVLRLNANEGSSRRFLLVQQPFDTKEDESEQYNICQRITLKRIGNAIKGAKRPQVDSLGGSMSFARLGDPLFGEYKNFGKKLPSWQDLAKYVFYTETSREIDLKKVDETSGFIGSTPADGGTSYYLLYTPNDKEDMPFDLKTLERLQKSDRNKSWVVYCEKIWMHPDELRAFEKTENKRVRPMLVPFNLK